MTSDIESKSHLQRIQEVDVASLARRQELGEYLSFEDALPSLQSTVSFCRKIPLSRLSELPASQQNLIESQTQSAYSIITRIRAFDPSKEENAGVMRQSLIVEARGTYQNMFDSLANIVSYISSTGQDFSAIESQSRAAIAAAVQQAADVSSSIAGYKQDAETALSAIRSIAAERGVSQLAEYYKLSADDHESKAKIWLGYTIKTAVGLGIYAFITLCFALYYEPKNGLQAGQIAIAKILMFSVIAYMLFQCARTFAAHQHNAAVNRHRQNSLLSFNAIVAAAGADDKRDIVLANLSNSIFAVQDTGYVKSTGNSSMPLMQLIESAPKLTN